MAYIVALMIYQVGSALFYGGSVVVASIAVVIALLVVGVVCFFLRPKRQVAQDLSKGVSR